MPLYKRYAETAGFPDTSGVLARLGVSISDGKVSLKRNAELAEIRHAITRTDRTTAAWRDQLAAN